MSDDTKVLLGVCALLVVAAYFSGMPLIGYVLLGIAFMLGRASSVPGGNIFPLEGAGAIEKRAKQTIATIDQDVLKRVNDALDGNDKLGAIRLLNLETDLSVPHAKEAVEHLLSGRQT